MIRTKANFGNTTPGELEPLEVAPSPTRDTAPTTRDAPATTRRRFVYASWHSDLQGLALIWIANFRERIEATDFQIELGDEPGEAGAPVQNRLTLEQKLQDVTDFVILGTFPYFGQEKKLGQESKLSWVLQSNSRAPKRAIWLAALEENLPIRKFVVHGVPDLLAVAQMWHPTKSENNIYEAFTFPAPDNPNMRKRFADEMNLAVSRIMEHDEGCSVCRC